jgi:predicted amidophosphoribosyltransferase
VRAPAAVGDLVQGLLDLVFAPVCLGCRSALSTRAADRRVCGACWSRMRAIPPPRCERCWNPHDPTLREHCPLCEQLPPALRAVRSAALMEGPARALVHALKYGGWSGVAPALAARMAALPLPLEVEEEVGLVVAVPLGRARMRERGYNQAAPLAADVARRKGWRDEPGLLVRARSTARQATLHPAERRANVAGAFSVPAALRPSLCGEHVLIVDDVWTTGATALACVEALLAAGARAASAITFARALPELGRSRDALRMLE